MFEDVWVTPVSWKMGIVASESLLAATILDHTKVYNTGKSWLWNGDFVLLRHELLILLHLAPGWASTGYISARQVTLQNPSTTLWPFNWVATLKLKVVASHSWYHQSNESRCEAECYGSKRSLTNVYKYLAHTSLLSVLPAGRVRLEFVSYGIPLHDTPAVTRTVLSHRISTGATSVARYLYYKLSVGQVVQSSRIIHLWPDYLSQYKAKKAVLPGQCPVGFQIEKYLQILWKHMTIAAWP